MNAEKLIVLTDKQLKELLEKSSKIAAQVAVTKVDEERKAARKKNNDRRLHNTEMLLRNYKMFKLSVENSVYTVGQLEKEMSANDMLNMMMDKDSNEIVIKSIKESKVRTAIIVHHIDTMLSLYHIYCERSNDELDLRRYEVLMDRYINEKVLSVKEIARKQNVSKESVYADLKIAKERVSALIFGVDGLQLSQK